MELKLTKPKGLKRWIQLYRLYMAAFPATERKPFSIIVRLHRSGKNDLWCMERNGEFLGFASMVNGKETVLLDYFAVRKQLRGQGVGSEALERLKAVYPEQGFFVEIESEYEPGADRKLRQKRKQFYLQSGMVPMHVMANVFGVKMELLGWNCRMNFGEYHRFYRDYLSPWAADHVKEEVHPERT